MPASTSTPERTVDVTDRAAALDRYSQISAVRDVLSIVLEITQLRDLTVVGHDNPEEIGELEALGLALWPVETFEDEEARDHSPEWVLAEARSDVLAAKLLLALADSADELRGNKADLLLTIAQMALTPTGVEKGGD